MLYAIWFYCLEKGSSYKQRGGQIANQLVTCSPPLHTASKAAPIQSRMTTEIQPRSTWGQCLIKRILTSKKFVKPAII